MTSSPEKSTPSIPWKTRLSIKVISTLTDVMCSKNGTVKRGVFNYLDLKSSAKPKPYFSVSSTDVTVDSTRNLWFRLFTPHISTTTNTNQSLPILIFFHGGGFMFLSAASIAYDFVCRRFAKKLPAYVLSVDYRLAPEFRCPAQYDDGFDVLKFIDDPNNRILLPENVDLSKCFLVGDSAGANIAHHVAVRACKADFKSVRVAGLVSIQPFFGGEERTQAEKRLVRGPLLVSVPRTDFCWKLLLPEGANRDHASVNVSGLNAEDLSGLDFPDTVVIVAGFDPLQDWQRKYYQWLKKSGKRVKLIEYPNMVHAFYIFPNLRESGQLIAQVKDFVTERMQHSIT
ncbi:hypothetical protein ACFE04_015322 [Oxalis oulophora]